MDHQDPAPQRRRLPEREEPGPDEARAARRDRGIRQARRLSNGTAAALIALTAVTAGYFAHAGAGARQAAVAARTSSQPPGAHRPCVRQPVATSGGSGVTTATVPSSCAAGQNGTGPTVIYAPSSEGRGEQ